MSRATTSPRAFATFRTWLQRRSGIALTDDQSYLVEHRLAPMVRERGGSLDDLLARAALDTALGDLVVEAMTTNETSFFRDRHPFEALRTTILPELIERNAATRRLRLLSGACSTGQEAYSLAMLLRTSFPQVRDWDVRIEGLDLSAAVVRRAAAGRYAATEVDRGLPQEHRRWLRRDGDELVVDDELRAWCRFRTHNLTGSWAGLGPYDVSLLRNVLIYFDAETKQRLLRELVDVTVPGGAILLGSTELTSGSSTNLVTQRVGRATVFRTPAREATPWAAPMPTSRG